MIHPICFLQHKASTWELRLCVCACVHMSECNFDVSSLLFALSLFLCVCMCVCLKIHQACLGFLQRAAAVGSNQPPLPMSEHTNPFVYLSTCCVCVRVCVCVYVSMLIQGRALPNTPWKHSIHQQLEAGALGPALHFHWERGRQRRGGEEEDMRLPQGQEEGHSSGYVSSPWGTGGRGGIYIWKWKGTNFLLVLSPSQMTCQQVAETEKLTDK